MNVLRPFTWTKVLNQFLFFKLFFYFFNNFFRWTEKIERNKKQEMEKQRERHKEREKERDKNEPDYCLEYLDKHFELKKIWTQNCTGSHYITP